MQYTPYYFRDQQHLYMLQSHSDYWFVVGKNSHAQIVFGIAHGKLLTLTLNPHGDLIKWEQEMVPRFRRVDQGRLLTVLYDWFADRVAKLPSDIFQPTDVIAVKRFWIPDHNVGISDIPDDAAEFASHPLEYTAAERLEYTGLLEDWMEEDLFVWWWNQSFTVDAAGWVTSS